jgi:hypothetical protein
MVSFTRVLKYMKQRALDVAHLADEILRISEDHEWFINIL